MQTAHWFLTILPPLRQVAHVLLVLSLLFVIWHGEAEAQEPILPVVFVHGLWSDDSTWDGIEASLEAQGYSYGGTFDSDLEFASSLTTVEISLRSDFDVTGTMWFLNFDYGSNSSNQEAVYKQSKALEKAIIAVLDMTGAQSVVLAGHSMGGLAIAGYLVGDPNGDGHPDFHQTGRVQRVVTMGTPFGGSDWAIAMPLLVEILDGGALDLFVTSSAFRDLAKTNVGTRNIFLYGGYESQVNGNVFEQDVNCNGIVDQTYLKGILEFSANEWPSEISYHNIIGTAGGIGDGLVLTGDQYLEFMDRRSINAWHTELAGLGCSETGSFEALIEGLDEPDEPAIAYSIGMNVSTFAHISCQNQGHINAYNDSDWFYVTADESGRLAVTARGIPPGATLGLYEDDGISLIDQDSGSAPLVVTTDVAVPGARYRIWVQSAAQCSDHSDPCDSYTYNLRNPYSLEPTLDPSPIHVSGTITTDNSTPISGALVTGPLGSDITGIDGRYELEVPFFEEARIWPSKDNFVFEPSDRWVGPLADDLDGIDFVGDYGPPEIIVKNLDQIPECLVPGALFRLHGEAWYSNGTETEADDTPLNGGIVEWLDGDCAGEQVDFDAYEFVTTVCHAQQTGGNVHFRIIDTDLGGYVDAEFWLCVDTESAVYVTEPTGDDQWLIGMPSTVAWEFPDASFPIEFYLSRDDGDSWEYLDSYVGSRRTKVVVVNDGLPTGLARIKVQKEGDQSIFDISERFVLSETTEIPFGLQIAGARGETDIDTETAFSPDGLYFAHRSAGVSGVTLYDARTLQQIRTFGNNAYAVAFSPNSQYLAWLDNEHLYVWGLTTGSWETNGHDLGDPEGEAVVWLDDSRLALIGDADGDELQVRVYSRSGSLQETLGGNVPFEFRTIDYHNGYLYASGLPDNSADRPFDGDGTYMYRWSTSSWSRTTYEVCMNRIMSLEVSRDGNYLVAVGDDDSGCDPARPNVKRFSIPSMNETADATWWSYNNRIHGLAWNPEGTNLVGVDDEGHAAIFGAGLNMVWPLESANSGQSAGDVAWSSRGVIAVLGNGPNETTIRFYAPNDADVPVITMDQRADRGSASFSGHVDDDTAVISLEGRVDNGEWFTISLDLDGGFAHTVENLDEGTHSLEIKAIDLADNFGTETTMLMVDCELPGAVQTGNPVGDTECLEAPVILNWTPIAGIETYDVSVGSDCGNEQIVQVTGLTLAFIPEDQSASATYWWKVRARTVCDTVGPWSDCRLFSVRADGVLAAPVPDMESEPVFTIDPIVLRWEAVGGATYYQVQMGDACGQGEIVDVGETSFEFHPNDHSSYSWRVRATDDCRIGAWSDCIEFSTTVPVLAPYLECRYEERAVALSWTGPVSLLVDDWGIERRSGLANWEMVATIGNDNSSWLDDDVLPGVDYTYRVVAQLSDLALRSNEVTTTIPAIIRSQILAVGPNPFNPMLIVEYALPAGITEASIIMRDVSGREVNRLAVSDRAPGYYRVQWDGTDATGRRVASGVYLIELMTKQGRDVKKATMLK